MSYGINVFDFGAKGDGTTDDTAAIQAAIDYTAKRGGGKIYFPYTPRGYLIASPAIEEVNGMERRALYRNRAIPSRVFFPVQRSSPIGMPPRSMIQRHVRIRSFPHPREPLAAENSVARRSRSRILKFWFRCAEIKCIPPNLL